MTNSNLIITDMKQKIAMCFSEINLKGDKSTDYIIPSYYKSCNLASKLIIQQDVLC